MVKFCGDVSTNALGCPYYYCRFAINGEIGFGEPHCFGEIEGKGKEGEGEEDYNPREDLVFVLIILTRMFTHRVTLVKFFTLLISTKD